MNKILAPRVSPMLVAAAVTGKRVVLIKEMEVSTPEHGPMRISHLPRRAEVEHILERVGLIALGRFALVLGHLGAHHPRRVLGIAADRSFGPITLLDLIHENESQRIEAGVEDAEPDLLERAIVNLLSNALKHSPPDSEVKITVHLNQDQIFCCIADHGPGIAAAAP